MDEQFVEIVGVHKVKATQPCHLIEIIIRNSDKEIDMSCFTQETPGKPESGRQVPYADMFPNSDGSEIIGDVMLDGHNKHYWTGNIRIAFFFHYLDLSKALKTPFGYVKLPEVTKRPNRLKIMKYEPVD